MRQGTLNYVLTQLRLVDKPVGWLSVERIRLPCSPSCSSPSGAGWYWYMVMYLAGLQGIPGRDAGSGDS